MQKKTPSKTKQIQELQERVKTLEAEKKRLLEQWLQNQVAERAVLATFDTAVEENVDPVTYEKIRKRISELNKPEEESVIIT